MADIDLSGEFEKISDKARTATAELTAASAKTKDQLDTDVAKARRGRPQLLTSSTARRKPPGIERHHNGKRSAVGGRNMLPR